MQYTYVLYTREEGVFYVGIGTKRRLYATINDAINNTYLESRAKKEEVQRRRAAGQEIVLEVVFEHTEKGPTQQCEKMLIEAYGPALTNHVGKNTAYPVKRTVRPPGTRKQTFPLKTCPLCTELWARVTDYYRQWNEHPNDRERQAAYRQTKQEYDDHIATHPTHIPQ